MTEIFISPQTPSFELRQLMFEYNWDDGFGLPQCVADHQNCDLALALEIFWLSESADVYLGKASDRPHNADRRLFSRTLARHILDGRYKDRSMSFVVPLSKVQIYNYRKSGLPEVFLSDLPGVRALSNGEDVPY